jgi:hypothetical protein
MYLDALMRMMMAKFSLVRRATQVKKSDMCWWSPKSLITFAFLSHNFLPLWLLHHALAFHRYFLVTGEFENHDFLRQAGTETF